MNMQMWGKLAALLCGLASATAMAQAWPSKPIRMLIGYPPGTSTDLIGRAVTTEMTKTIGQPFIIENRAGAAGLLAIRAATQAEPDGYTFVMAASLISMHPIFRSKDEIILSRDLTGIADIAAGPWVLFTRPEVAKSWQELIAKGKANPKKLNFGSIAPHIDLGFAYVAGKAGFTYTLIGYPGPPVTQMLNGEVDMYIGTTAGITQHIQSGKMVPVLFFDHTGVQNDYPNTANAVDLGLLPKPILPIFGFYGPRKLPNEVVQKMAQQTAAVSKVPQLIADIRKLGCVIFYQNAEQQTQYYNELVTIYTEAAKMTNYKPVN